MSPAGGVNELAAALAPPAGPVRHRRTTYVPADETCFDLLEAPSLEAALDTLARAQIRYDRITEAVE